ncbi:hypothetical protein MUP56_02430 [Patescibacteria group bacterium]|nr:hypothetical protein [Patescibacteria group bacterium]
MNLSSSIFFTLSYGDIFQYPYTENELFAWLPENTWTKKAIQKQLRYLQKRKKISYAAPFYCIRGHTKHIKTRLQREHGALGKWEKAEFAASLLRFIPTITLVGITGGLSNLNTDKNDDIDFYIGTKPQTLWISRLLATLLMEAAGIRRRPEDTEVKDAICLNMLVSEDAFMVSKGEQDIFTAHEVLQMKPLWERGNAYADFLKKNRWVSSVFPNKWKEVIRQLKRKKKIVLRYGQFQFATQFLRFLEKPSNSIQLWYMKKRRTSEVISDTVIRFHPHDARLRIQTLLRSNVKRYHLPLDKIFFRT